VAFRGRLADEFLARGPRQSAEELNRTVTELEQMTAHAAGDGGRDVRRAVYDELDAAVSRLVAK
jgi:hypothetical protein